AGFIGSPPMNFLPVTVEGTSAKLPFGSVELPPEKAEKAAGKGLLMAGIRPEHFEDASVKGDAPAGSTFRATVEVVEWLGNETYAYIPFEAPPEVEQQLQQLERDLDGESLHTQLVVSLDGASRIREGEEAEIWVDGSKIHLFDPSTGDNLTVDHEHAGRIEGHAMADAAEQPAAAG
ncbi:MAG TPA: TOBE domain-containing protein, partial [Nocardioides sp.]|nr:TOBE domain-containing protein [Nocardioides sp.]